MSAYTPGPWYWHVDADGRASLRTPDRGNLIVMDIASRGKLSTPRFAIWSGMDAEAPRNRMGGILVDGHTESHPDARLIAAAPELLEALRYAEAFISIAVPSTARDRDEAVNEVLPAIRAAIAKATGNG